MGGPWIPQMMAEMVFMGSVLLVTIDCLRVRSNVYRVVVSRLVTVDCQNIKHVRLWLGQTLKPSQCVSLWLVVHTPNFIVYGNCLVWKYLQNCLDSVPGHYFMTGCRPKLTIFERELACLKHP